MGIRTGLHPLGGGMVKIDTTPIRFDYTGTKQEYKVPAGVRKIAVDCVGGTDNGKGGRVQCVLKTRPGQMLYIVVAQASARGYNASDIRTTPDDLSSRLVVAGGGGEIGKGDGGTRLGGAGGGLVGGSGAGVGDFFGGAAGGSQTEGGNGSGSGSKGGFGLGGAGQNSSYSGNGGAGWYGGGGGGYRETGSWNKHYYGGSGGGGSSYTAPELCTDVVHIQGFNPSGNGYVILTPLKK